MSFRKKIFKNTMMGWVSIAVSVCTRLVTVPLILSGVGKNYYALYALVTSLINYLYLFDSGISGAVCRLYSLYFAEGDEEKVKRLISTAYGFLILVVILLSLVFIALPEEYIFKFLNVSVNDIPLLHNVLIITFLEFLIVFLSRVDIGILQGKNQFNVFWSIESIVSIVGTGLIFFFYKVDNLTLINIALINSGTRAAGAIILFLKSGYIIEKLAFFNRFSFKLLRVTLDLGSSAAIVTFAGILQNSLAPSVYSKYLSVDALFFVSISTALMLMVSRFVNTIFSSFTPYISALKPKEHHGNIKDILMKGLSFSCFSHGVICIVSSLLLDTVLRLWLSSSSLSDSDFVTLYFFTNLLFVSLLISNSTKIMDITFSSTGIHWKSTFLSLSTSACFSLALLFLAKEKFLYAYPISMIAAGIVKVGGSFRIALKTNYFSYRDIFRIMLEAFILPLGLSFICIYRYEIFDRNFFVTILPIISLLLYLLYGCFFSMSWLVQELKVVVNGRRHA